MRVNSSLDHSPLLSVRGLSVSYAQHAGARAPALIGIDLDVWPGETVAVVGESGSGKSTLAAAIERLLASNAVIDGGEIAYEGRDLLTLTETEMGAIRGSAIGFVPQNPMSNLNPLMRVGQQVAESLEVHGAKKGPELRRRACSLLESAGIADAEQRMRQYPHEFSGGMRQRVLIAMAMACSPRLLIADEPTSALDVTVQKLILDQLGELAERSGTAVLLITHDLALASERADRVVVMYRGRVVESGPAAAVMDRPSDNYTRRLVGAAAKLRSIGGSRATTNDDDPDGLATADADATEPPLVRLDQIRKQYSLRGQARYGRHATLTAVDSISFEVRRGQTVSLVGESGSGKTTVADLLLGLTSLTAGSILFDGKPVTGLKRQQQLSFRRRVQPVFQDPFQSLDPRYTVIDSLIEPLRVHRVGDRRTQEERCRQVLDLVALPSSVMPRYPHEMSGGQQQRVAIARALTLSPDMIVFDEPLSALDLLIQSQIIDLILDLQSELGLTYLFISHDLAVVGAVSHTIHVLRRGQIIESGTPAALFSSPQNDYTRELLNAVPGQRLAVAAPLEIASSLEAVETGGGGATSDRVRAESDGGWKPQ